MPTNLLEPGTLAPLVADVHYEAQSTEEKLGDREVVSLRVHAGDVDFELPDHLTAFLVSVIGTLADGSAIGITSLPEELTTTTAAQRLGISRPTLIKLIKSGRLASYKVGSHTRIKRDVLTTFVEERQQQRYAAIAALREIDAEYEMDSLDR